MVNFKSYTKLTIIGFLVLSCATHKPNIDIPPAFNREACLTDNIKQYLNSGHSFMDSVWYYREAYPLPFPDYNRYVDSLIENGAKYNIPVIGIRYDAPCPSVDSPMKLLWGTSLLHEYCKKCDSAENINRIIELCTAQYYSFLQDSLGLSVWDPRVDESEDDRSKRKYLNTISKHDYEDFKNIVLNYGDLKKLK